MAMTTGSDLLARALKRQGADTMFYLMGGPMLAAETACIEEGIRSIDVRHEQAAAMMAHAYGRVMNKLGVCMAASGPATTNLVTGVANAWADAAPLLAIGGAAPGQPVRQGRVPGDGPGRRLQADHQVGRAHARPAAASPSSSRPPIRAGARRARRGRSTSTCPATCSTRRSTRDEVVYPDAAPAMSAPRPPGDPAADRARPSRCSAKAERPIVITGSGILWSDASQQLRQLRRADGHPVLHHAAGSRRRARRPRAVVPGRPRDRLPRGRPAIVVVGTRINYVDRLPRAAALQRRRQADPGRHRRRPRSATTARPTSGSSAMPRAVLEQLLPRPPTGSSSRSRYSAWVDHLRDVDDEKHAGVRGAMSTDADADPSAAALQGGPRLPGPRRHPGGRRPGDPELRPPVDPDVRAGPPPELRARSARWASGCRSGSAPRWPSRTTQVLVLHGDGSFGLNAMELDTAVRCKHPGRDAWSA